MRKLGWILSVPFVIGCSASSNDGAATNTETPAPAADAAAPTPNAEVAFVDAVGTAYGSDGSSIPGAHEIFSFASLPSREAKPTYADADRSEEHGCSVTRLDAATMSFDSFVTDLDLGPISLTGYATSFDGDTVDGKHGAPGGTIACTTDSRHYRCTFAPSGGALDGARWDKVTFRALPADAWLFKDTLAVKGDGASIDERAVAPSPALTITAIEGGGDAAASSHQLDDLVLDGTSDVTLSWTCDDCGTDLVRLHLVTQNDDNRADFEPKMPFGSVECAERAASGKVVLRKDTIQAALGRGDARSRIAKLWLYRFAPRRAGTAEHPITLAVARGHFGFASVH